MPNASPSQRLDEISRELEALRTQSLSHPEKAAKMIQDGLEQLQVSLKELTISVGEGHTEAERDAFVEDKLACEHEKHMARQERLLEATRKVLAQKGLNRLAPDSGGNSKRVGSFEVCCHRYWFYQWYLQPMKNRSPLSYCLSGATPYQALKVQLYKLCTLLISRNFGIPLTGGPHKQISIALVTRKRFSINARRNHGQEECCTIQSSRFREVSYRSQRLR